MRWSILAVGLAVACGDGVQRADCSALPLEVPDGAGEWEAVADPGRDRLITFGGNVAVPVNCAPGSTDFVADTWAYHRSCEAWEKLDSPSTPPARGRYAMALDAEGERVLLHGGRFRAEPEGDYTVYGDTWVLDLTTDEWSRWQTDGAPRARSNHAGVVLDGGFFIVGGNTSTNGGRFEPLDDVWRLDLETRTWQRVQAPNGPDARLFHSIAGGDGVIYVYGGGDEGAFLGPFFGDLWALEVADGKWTRLAGDGGNAPRTRIWANLELDAEGRRLLMFGGHDETELGNLNDLWAFDLTGGGWSQLREGDVQANPANGVCDFPADFATIDPDSPERREAGASAFDGGALWVIGGKSDCGNLNDVWSYDVEAGAWDNPFRATEGEVCLRAQDDCESLCF